MRHSISGRKLNRTSSHRKALFKNLSNSLIINEQIKTTLPKAKDLRAVVEKIITMGKKDNLHSKRRVFSILRSNESVNKVFNILSKRYLKRSGGYTRVLKAGYRYGDSAPMAIIEFIERDTNAKGLVDKERLEKINNEDESNKDIPSEDEKNTKAKKNNISKTESVVKKDKGKKDKTSEEEKK